MLGGRDLEPYLYIQSMADQFVIQEEIKPIHKIGCSKSHLEGEYASARYLLNPEIYSYQLGRSIKAEGGLCLRGLADDLGIEMNALDVNF